MLIFFADETYVKDQTAKKYGLSIYGGLVLDSEQVKTLTNFLYKIKDRYLYPQNLEFKWRFKSVYDKMYKVGFLSEDFPEEKRQELYSSLQKDYDSIKEDALKKIAEVKASIVIAIRPNTLLNASEEKSIEYSIGAITKKFRKILNDHDEVGIILADELKSKLSEKDIVKYEYILNLCSSERDNLVVDKLLSIVPTVDSCISPIHQINDIMLGAIQYYILEFMRMLEDGNRDTTTAKNLFGIVLNNFYKSRTGGYVINNGILLYPPKNSRELTKAGIFLNNLEKQLRLDFNIK